MSKLREFDIALSFAGEDRDYVDQVANLLRDSGVKVFYDLFEEANLWGKNLYDYLSEIYMNKALYTIMFISKHYAHKLLSANRCKLVHFKRTKNTFSLPGSTKLRFRASCQPLVTYLLLDGRLRNS